MRRLNATSSYVSAEPQLGELDPLMEHALTQTLERDVLVPVFQNLAGGLGVFVVIVAAMFGWIDYGGSTATTRGVLIAAAYCGMVAFGFACAYRAFKDEVQSIIYHRTRARAEGSTNARLEFLEDEVERLMLENRQLNIANAQMAGRRAPIHSDEPAQGKPRPVEDEYSEPLFDALALCRFHEAHNTIAREKAMSAGMTRNRWDAARRLLASSGVPINGSVFGVPVVVAMGYVREFVEKQRSAPAGFVMPNED